MFYTTTNREILLDYPDKCPVCKKHTEPKCLFNVTKNISGITANHVVLACPNQECNMVYIALYRLATNEDINNVGGGGGTFRQQGSTYYIFDCIFIPKPGVREFSDEINSLSPDFVKIYNEAYSAEQLSLGEVAGMGYRKSIEFLIKDYLIKQNTTERSSIEAMYLGNCIKDKVTDKRIQQIAARAVWLGNDETHYVRKWVDKDISDLKQAIDLTIFWIEAEILSIKMISEMPE